MTGAAIVPLISRIEDSREKGGMDRGLLSFKNGQLRLSWSFVQPNPWPGLGVVEGLSLGDSVRSTQHYN